MLWGWALLQKQAQQVTEKKKKTAGSQLNVDPPAHTGSVNNHDIKYINFL